MRTFKLGRTGLEVTPVVYGAIIHMNENQEAANSLVATAVDRGINYFDVAPSYQDAEVLLGPALEPYRSKVHLACKTGERTAEGSRRELLTSLKNLRTDHFDVYQFHALTTKQDLETVFAPVVRWRPFCGLKRKA
jgi:aryl-alcohol dehydrogenase-like predicted oxidoreductase